MSFMLPVQLGTCLDTNSPVFLDRDGLSRHLHACGATGSGKSVSLNALLRPIMAEPSRKAAVFVIDPLGGLSRDLIMYMASPKCPEHVRKRLLYIDASSDEHVLPFNPLQSATGSAMYYGVARTVDLILRAWSSQDLSQMARLMQWSYSTGTALANAQLPLTCSEFLLHRGTEEHKAFIRQMPEQLRAKWLEIFDSRGGEGVRILESTRNRFEPFFTSPHTRWMFGVSEGRFDTEQLIEDRRIVVIDVSPKGRLTPMISSTIGALYLNEILETAFKLASTKGRKAVDPTLIVLDEFQRFIGPDIEDAIPTVRQAGLQLVLAHQSFSQLKQGELDLTSMIWQCQNRLFFANSAEDADIIANELAIHKFDPDEVKLAIYQRKQLVAGYRREWLNSVSESSGISHGSSSQDCVGFNLGSSISRVDRNPIWTRSTSRGSSRNHSSGESTGESNTKSLGQHEQLVPILEDLRELSSVQYRSFDEVRLKWMKIVRQLKTGHCFGKFVDNDTLYRMLVKYEPVEATKRAIDRYRELLQRNFEQPCFISREQAEQEHERARQKLLSSSNLCIEIRADANSDTTPLSAEAAKEPQVSVFRKSRRKV